MRRFIKYLKKLTESDSAESSKRFIALISMLMVGYVVGRFTNHSNMEIVLGELLGFVLALLAVAVWQSVKNKNRGESKKID
tara:strand:+ start:153 stop:395 length:243 start_codon:yes stop_codon:yes gene_type:complete